MEGSVQTLQGIAKSGTLRLETVRCRFPEIAELYDLHEVSPTLLSDISSEYSQTQAAIRKISKDGDTTQAIEALTQGLRILDFLSSLTTDRDYVERKVSLLIGTKQYCLGARGPMLIRYTIDRICDTFFPAIEDFLTFVSIGGLPCGIKPGQVASYLQMIKRKAFETAVYTTWGLGFPV